MDYKGRAALSDISLILGLVLIAMDCALIAFKDSLLPASQCLKGSKFLLKISIFNK